MFRSLPALALLFLPGAFAGDLLHCIRQNDLAGLQQEIARGADLNQADARGNTPLHQAALVGSVDALRMLLHAGARPDVRNTAEATPLILAATSLPKVKLLLAAGANANARSKSGRMPLLVAAGRSGGVEIVRALLEAGAKVDEADELGITPLNAAADGGDIETIELLLARGAAPDRADKAGGTPLLNAAATGELRRIRVFLAKGANVNAANLFAGKVRHGNIALVKMTPLILAAAQGSSEVIAELLKAGANPNAQDGRGITPLMAAVAAETQDTGAMRALIAAGADVNAVDAMGASVLDWARRFGYPQTVALLESAGAKSKAAPVAVPVRTAGAEPLQARAAAERSLELLVRSSAEFFKQSGCSGCHHQPATSMAVRAARQYNLRVPAGFDAVQQATFAATRPLEPALAQMSDPGGQVDTVATTLLGFAAAGLPAGPLTDAGAHYIASKQQQDGSWRMPGIARVPVEGSDITRTTLAVRALRAYELPARKEEFDERVGRARQWLSTARPRTSYELADQLIGLHAAGAGPKELARVAAALLRDQRPDGGWAQNRYSASDPYATGLALTALHTTGQAKATDKTYRRGVEFLLRTRLDDGSWYVASRAPKFQPYFQSGFPHDHDQWISASATAYAVTALAPVPDVKLTARR